ncbi:MAG TPA: GNAT family N-acetyltransferase [Vicinamibacterales bacterium]|nr:GNAT family N-acetyltransferase [Vicinamibacterales bacterium]
MPADLADVRQMLEEYVAWIGLDLAFQQIDEELAGLPGEYALPGGAMFVADLGGALVGMVAIRPLTAAARGEAVTARIAEMKRLYVRPAARGRGLAKRLIDHALQGAKRLGYEEVRLDTLPMMRDAQALYLSLGFVDIEPYYDTPIEGTRFMSKTL